MACSASEGVVIYSYLLNLVRLLAITLFVASIGGCFSQFGLLFELLCHFRVQYLLLALIPVVVFLVLRKWRWSSLALLTVVINAVAVLPWYLCVEQLFADRTVALTLVQSNLYSGNRDQGGLLSLVDVEQPDLLLVQELSADTRLKLQPLSATLPYAFTVPRPDNFGIAIYSKRPLRSRQLLTFGEMALPALYALVDVDGHAVHVLAAHPPPPIGGELFRERNRYLRELAAYVAGLSGPVIVAGDLNSSMWSSYYQSFEHLTGLRNARLGFGVIPTWPAGFSPMAIPLDHCLVSKNIAVSDISSGAGIGSDHFPLIVRLDMSL